MVKISDSDIIKLKALTNKSTWKDLKEVQPINNEIKNLDIYDNTINTGCIKYLKETVVSKKEFDSNEMFKKCKDANAERKKKAPKKGRRGGVAGVAKADKAMLSKKSREELQEDDKNKNKVMDNIVKDATAVFKALINNKGDIEGTLKQLIDNGFVAKKTYEWGMASLMGVINYLWGGTGNVYVVGVQALSLLGGLIGIVYKNKESIQKIINYLKGLFKWAKKKGFKFFGFGDGDGDDDDDGGGGGGGGNRPSSGNQPEVYTSDTDFQSMSGNIQGGGGGDSGGSGGLPDDPPPKYQAKTSGETGAVQELVNMLKQQSIDRQRSNLKQSQLETDVLLRETNPTPQKHTTTTTSTTTTTTPTTTTPTTSTPKPSGFKKGGKEFFKYDTMDKFKNRYDDDMNELRKEDKYKSFTDDDFKKKYDAVYEENTSEGLDNILTVKTKINYDDAHPIKKHSVVPLNDIENISKPVVYDSIGNALETGVGHTTPSSYWEAIQDYGASASKQIPLAMTATSLGILGTASYYGNNLTPKTDPELIERNMEIGSSPRMLGQGRPLAAYRDLFPSTRQSAAARIRASSLALSRQSSTSSNIMDFTNYMGSRMGQGEIPEGEIDISRFENNDYGI